MLISISPAAPEHMDDVRTLFHEYRALLDAEACFLTYAAEMEALPAGYHRILLAHDGPVPAGVVALRPLADGVCEMKRLFVRPAYQRTGLGRRLVDETLLHARALGYTAMRLDTLPSMARAIALYQAMGFRTIARYNDNPEPQALFFEKLLR